MKKIVIFLLTTHALTGMLPRYVSQMLRHNKTKLLYQIRTQHDVPLHDRMKIESMLEEQYGVVLPNDNLYKMPQKKPSELTFYLKDPFLYTENETKELTTHTQKDSE